MWAVLGGTGFEQFENFHVLKEIEVDTPFGKPSAAILSLELSSVPILFLSRHGKHHEYSPSDINYRANIFSLKKLGATKLLSISSVGSLQADYVPGDCVVPTQYIDRTKSLRAHTFCTEGVLGHVSLAKPVNLNLLSVVKQFLRAQGYQLHYDKTYLCIEGPAYSTQAESHYYRSLGADVIGMTNFPEYALAREAGLYYLPLSFVTDFDCWNDEIEHVTVAQVASLMQENKHKAFDLIQQIITQTHDLFPEGCVDESLKSGLMTPIETLPEAVQAWVNILCQSGLK